MNKHKFVLIMTIILEWIIKLTYNINPLLSAYMTHGMNPNYINSSCISLNLKN